MTKASKKNTAAAVETKQVIPAETSARGRKAVVVPEELMKLFADMKDENTSTKIRAAHAAGYSRGQIAKGLTTHLGREDNPVRYQHVRNVLITPVKRPQTGAEA